jgi:LCP family protein required for cell wall assembly
MDGIRRNPTRVFQKKIQPFSEKTSTFQSKRKEEIFVTRQEAELMDKYEKKYQKKSFLKKIVLLFIFLLFIAMIGYGLYFSWKVYVVSQTMNSQTKTSLLQYARALVSPILPNKKMPLRGEENGRINILLLGAAGKHKPGGNLTDTIMLMSIDTENKKVALLSLPRDLYVKIPESANHTKINSLYSIDVKKEKNADLVKQVIEEITNINIDYYLAIDFDGFEKIIDNIGGINIISERDIYDTRYPGPNYSYETFSLSKGFHLLDGATALKYVRERHDDPEGDFGRAKRQQQVIQAVKNKLFSVQTFFNVNALSNIIATLGESVRTDIGLEDLESFIALSKKVDLQNITNVVLDAWKEDSLLKVSHINFDTVTAFILLPRVGSYSEIQDLANNIFDQTEIKKRRETIAAEKASIGIINQSSDNQLDYKIQNLLKDKLKIKNVRILSQTKNTTTDKTTLIDNSRAKKLFTLDELVKKLPATLTTEKPAEKNSTDYDIVILLGNDLADIYKYEEASMEYFQKYQDSNENINLL